MEIAEYIKLFKRQLFYPRLKEESQLSKFFKNIAGKNGIEFIEIYSTTVFPQFIKIDDKSCMLWDNHFWDMYERFLSGIIVSEAPNSNPNAIFEYFNAISFLILTNRFENVPSLSFLFSKRYAGTGFAVPPYNKFEVNPIRDKLTDAGYHKRLISGKLYVFFHEFMHSLFKNNPVIFDEDIKDIIRLCTEYISIEGLDNKDRNTALHIVQNKDNRLIEEISCDLRAITESIKLLQASTTVNTDITQVLLDYIIDIRYLITFHGSMMQIEGTWQSNRKGIDKYGVDFILHSEDQIIQQGIISNEVNSRINLILYLALRVHGDANVTFTGYDFINTEWFEKCIVPPLEFARSSTLMKNVFEEYLSISSKYSPFDFRTSKDMLVGWY